MSRESDAGYLKSFVGTAILALCGVALATAQRSSDRWAVSPASSQFTDNAGAKNVRRVPVVLSQDIRFSHLSLEQGLSHSTVFAIAQDDYGFMWFGTEDGLNRYDGYRFSVYRHDRDNPESLNDNWVDAIQKDQAGFIWLGLGGQGGLSRLNPSTQTFTQFRHNPSDPRSLNQTGVTNIFEDRAGNLWIGSGGFDTITNDGLDKLDRTTQTFAHYRHDPKNPASLSSDTVRTTYEDSKGVLWVGTNLGLDGLDPRTGLFIHYRYDPANPNSLNGNNVTCILEDRSGVLWVGTNPGGLNALDRDRRQITRYQTRIEGPESPTLDTPVCLYEDRSGTLWIGTGGGGLLKFDPERRQIVRYKKDPANSNSLSNDFVFSLYQDPSGMMWAGTSGGGVNKFKTESSFVHYKHESNNPNSLHDNFVLSVYEDREGALWIGNDRVLNRFDRRTGRFAFFRNNRQDPHSISNGSVTSIHEDRGGVLWFGTFLGGLNRFNRNTGQFKAYWPGAEDSNTSGNIVMSIIEDSAGLLWLGTWHGLYRFNPKTEEFKAYRHDPNDPHSLSEDTIQFVYQDRFGMLWVGTRNAGLNRLDRQSERFKIYRYRQTDPNSLGGNFVSCLLEDTRGTLWVGTSGGLSRFERATDMFTVYTEKDGLCNNTIQGILEDGQGHLWLSTNNGLSRFDPQTKIFRNYDVSDGLQSNQFNVFHVCHKSRSGEMFFGGINGLNAFYPKKVKDNSYVPPVVLTEFRLFDRPLAPGFGSPLQKSIWETEGLTLSDDQDTFSVEFAALSYAAPERNRYRYQLQGLEAEWKEVDSHRRLVRYTNLDPGEYVFRVQGSNEHALWNEKGASLRIVITPAWWQTWWLRSAAAFTFLGLIIGGYRLRVRSLEERERRFRTLAENAPDIVVRFDPELRYRYINPAVEEYTGLSPSAFLGKSNAELGMPEDQARYWDAGLRQVFQTGKPAVQEFALPTPKGERIFESRLVPETTADGYVQSVLAITRDITQRKQAEGQLQASLEEKEALLKEVHHRVKNNLQLISSLLSLQAARIEDPAIAELLAESRNRVRSMALVHENLYRAGNFARIPMAHHIENLCAHLARAYGVQSRQVELALRIGDVQLDLDRAISCGLIINELVSNALKHAFPDGRVGRVCVELQPLGDKQQILSVGDNGVGVPPDLDYRRSDSLGLQLVDDLTQQLHGTLAVKRDGGTTFTITFDSDGLGGRER